MHDLVIRGGTVADGTGAPTRTADVAITDGLVSEVGRVDGPATREVDADGALVTPGFVDIHTHYDGQVTWDPLVTPSGWHGVTTVVMGNCGVGFAPCAPDRRQWLIGLMEGVEDIPGAALSTGINWSWESFPEFLDALDDVPKAVDIAAQVPHGAVRAYVMGERGARNEPATSDDIAAMAEVVRDGTPPVRSASPPAAPSPTAPSTVNRCRGPSPPKTSCSASAGSSAIWAPACSSWRPPEPWARTWLRRRRRWRGCAAWPPRSTGRSPSPSTRTTPMPGSGSACSP